VNYLRPISSVWTHQAAERGIWTEVCWLTGTIPTEQQIEQQRYQ